MKFLLVALVVVIGLWLLLGRGRRGGGSARGRDKAAPAVMVSCVHCGVHVPQADALADAAGRFYCTEAHRLAGPKAAP